jgi:hypothetical protein
MTARWLHTPRPEAAGELRKATPDNPDALRRKIRFRFFALVRATYGVVGCAGEFQ